MLQLDQIRVVLVETSHPGNIGATARAMANMGLNNLVLVNPKEFPSTRATARAAGADDILDSAAVVSDVASAVIDCDVVIGTSARLRSISWLQHSPSEAAHYVANCADTAGVALVFGRERSGLSNDELDLCQSLIHISVDEAHTSLNLASAVMVVLYEMRQYLVDKAEPMVSGSEKKLGGLAKNSTQIGLKNLSPPAVSAQLEHFFRQVDQTNNRIDFYKGNSEKVMRKIRKLIYKSDITREELNILQGIFTVMNDRLDELE